MKCIALDMMKYNKKLLFKKAFYTVPVKTVALVANTVLEPRVCPMIRLPKISF